MPAKIVAGYVAKKIVIKIDALSADPIEDIYLVSGCISEYFGEDINCWKHNGGWMFESLEMIKSITIELRFDLADVTNFYDEDYEFQCHID